MDNLPIPVTTFVGRRREIAQAKRLLESTRALTLTGVGGVGKTRLALAVAHQLRRAYTDGVWFVPLADLSEPKLITQTVIRAIGAHLQGPDLDVALIDYLRGRQVLLVLDNCEHLLDACAVLVDQLISRCPELRVLATSREPLRISGERSYPVPPLRVPALDRPPEAGDNLAVESMALFEERASAVRPDFSVTPANQQAVATLCRKLDGLPLAIELAAVRMRALPLDELLARQDDRYALLVRGPRDLSPRHQTLRAAVDWSFELCSPLEQTLWARASVFAGGFTIPDVEQVCVGDGLDAAAVLETVAGLVDKSILSRSERGAPARFRMLETLREYGRERLRERGEVAPLLQRHRDHYLEVAERFAYEWFGPGQLERFAHMRAEEANLRAAIEYSVTAPPNDHSGLRLGSSLWAYWFASGLQQEGRHWVGLLLNHDQQPSNERACALWAAAHLAILAGEMEAASDLLKVCEGLTVHANQDLLARLEYTLALVALAKGDVTAGITHVESSILLEESIEGPSPFIAIALIVLGYAHCVLGDAQRGTALLEDARQACEAACDRFIRSWSVVFLGFAYCIEGRTEASDALLYDSLQEKRTFDDVLGMSLAIEFLAWTSSAEDPHRAATLFGICESLWEPLGSYLIGFEALLTQHDKFIENVRQELDEQAFNDALHQGARMPRRAAIAYALRESPEPSAERTSADARLTKREGQIAKLITQGMSNKEISSTLVISARTVETHVEHIFQKLGFTSRAQVAAWITERRIEGAFQPGRNR